ncbi:hypothetical protein TREMEDRAFT_59403 [Tremella mesenterica DSM 1558]|uniref:uncharacterized protein n=1 Tax=Tremella mesenterica (strain ATCC 24925 / CBS 8224 / DSM 1558 / NBRC 9311 / NRRL Y-6157 / RJB 2259-6 / UBC 559-6) TaxID=578456 RepID=UPI0003F4983E|nr:uncharacterized protein TREMEDRAFT_59403 [Tremella mesenterica DSM 1558]EIW73235.1 hypothetical protein TREMEDRAFT_59403 [Tremella mesenterica DSM 1558]
MSDLGTKTDRTQCQRTCQELQLWHKMMDDVTMTIRDWVKRFQDIDPSFVIEKELICYMSTIETATRELNVSFEAGDSGPAITILCHTKKVKQMTRRMFNAVLKWIGSLANFLNWIYPAWRSVSENTNSSAATTKLRLILMEVQLWGMAEKTQVPFKSTSDKPTGIAELSKLLDNLLSLLEDPTDALELGADDDTPPTEAPENPEGGSGTEIGKKNKKKKKKKKNGDKTTTQGTSSESGVNARYRQDTATTLVNDDLVDQGHVKDSHISLADSTERLSGIPYVSSPMSSTATLV